MTHDQKCFDLAEAVLSDQPHLWTSKRVDELAAIIKITVETYVELEEFKYEPPDPPGFEAGFADNH